MIIFYNRFVLKSLLTKLNFTNFNYKLVSQKIIKVSGDSKLILLRDYLTVLIESIPVFLFEIEKLFINIPTWYKNQDLLIDIEDFKILKNSKELAYIEYLYNVINQNSHNLLKNYSNKFKNRYIFLIICSFICIIYYIVMLYNIKKGSSIYG